MGEHSALGLYGIRVVRIPLLPPVSEGSLICLAMTQPGGMNTIACPEDVAPRNIADEQVSPALAAAIRQEMAAPARLAYRVPRCNRFLGRYLRHGEGYPDWNLRLFHRAHARWSDHTVHEFVQTAAEVGSLTGDLLHDSAESLDSYLAKQNRYTTLAAEAAVAAGKRASYGRLLLSPVFRFIKFYLVRRSFLDGLPGLVHTLIGCSNSFFKYAKMLELQKRAKP